MPRALFNGTVIAESDDTVVVEGNHYFPPDAIRAEFFVASDHHTRCFWKGVASYFHVVVDGDTAENAAWYYPSPLPEAEHVKDRIAFWNGVRVEE